MADTSAITIVISWLYPTLTSKTVNVSVGRKSGNSTYCPGSLHELPHRRSSASMPSVSPIIADDLVLHAHTREHPGEQFQHQTHGGPEHEQAQQRRRLPGHALLDVEPVEDVRGDGRDGAVGEVEDTRCLVREDEAGAGEAVDGAGGEPDHDERERNPARGATPLGSRVPSRTARHRTGRCAQVIRSPGCRSSSSRSARSACGSSSTMLNQHELCGMRLTGGEGDRVGRQAVERLVVEAC